MNALSLLLRSYLVNKNRSLVLYQIHYIRIFLCPIYGHYVFWSVRPFVRLFVRPFVRPFVRLSRFRLKFLVEVVFDEVEVQSTSNLVHMFPMI